MVFAGNRIKTKEKATPNYSGANMQDSNLAGIEHFRTRESSHPKKKKWIAVGTAIAGRPPHRSVRE